MIAGERGFTMVTVVISMLVVMTLSIAALAAAQGDLKPAKHDTDRKIAYAAAEAGMQNYVFHLIDDANYWAKCTTVGGAVNDPWDGVSARNWASVPGSRARYTIELLPAPGYSACSTANPDKSFIDDATTGTFRIRVTGQALKLDGTGGVKRTLVVNFKRQSLLDFIYFTDKEVLDPSLYTIDTGMDSAGHPYQTDMDPTATIENVTQWGTGATNNGCNRYYGDNAALGNRGAMVFDADNGAANTGFQYPAVNNVPAGSGAPTWYKFSMGCKEITFASGDVIRGPLHTNDEVMCQSGSPTIKFGRKPADRIEVVSSGENAATPTGYRGCTPYVNFGTPATYTDAGTWKGKDDPTVSNLALPPSNSSLHRDTAMAYRFVGPTTVVMNGATMTVTGKREDGSVLAGASLALPADGVMYVANDPAVACTGYNPIDTDAPEGGCGNLKIQGTYNVSATFTAESDIVVTDDIKLSGTSALLGLISNNFIRVSHIVSNQTFVPQFNGAHDTVRDVDQNCTNTSGAPIPNQIDAAILSLNHSWIVDNYYCGASLGTLTVNGAIVQQYRGTVGTTGGTGYIKNYTYDDRLKYRSPPKFLDPIKAGWVVQTYNEQIPAR